MSPFEQLPAHIIALCFELVVDARADSLAERLAAAKRGAILMLVSRSLRDAARRAVYERLTVTMNTPSLAGLQHVITGGRVTLANSQADEPVSQADRVRFQNWPSPFVRDLELVCAFPDDADPSADAVALVDVFDRLHSRLRRLHFMVECDVDKVLALVIGASLLQNAMKKTLPQAYVGRLEVKSRSQDIYELPIIAEKLQTMTQGALRVFGPSLRILELIYPCAVDCGAIAVPADMALRSFVSYGAPAQLIEAIGRANAATLAHIELRAMARLPIFAPPLTAVTSMTTDVLNADTIANAGTIAWESVPALRSLEVMNMPAIGNLQAQLPASLHELRLHLGGAYNNLLDLVNWLNLGRQPSGLRRLRIDTLADFAPRYASAPAIALLADAGRARAVSVELVDELGRWALSA